MCKIAVVGFGFVGQSVFANLNQEPIVYDKYKDGLNSNEIKQTIKNQTKFIFACLPTIENENGSQDFSAYEDFFEWVDGYKGIIIVKSTVIYEYIKPYLDKFNIVMNPEFLNANTAFKDFENEKVVVLGGRADHLVKVRELYKQEFAGKNEVEFELCSHKEAIDLKYFHNIFHAYLVLFWNFCEEMTGNQSKVFQLYSKITGNTKKQMMAQVASDGKNGYGGACFPKDVNAYGFINNHELTNFMKSYNNRIRNEILRPDKL